MLHSQLNEVSAFLGLSICFRKSWDSSSSGGNFKITASSFSNSNKKWSTLNAPSPLCVFLLKLNNWMACSFLPSPFLCLLFSLPLFSHPSFLRFLFLPFSHRTPGDLNLVILLPQSLQRWDHRYAHHTDIHFLLLNNHSVEVLFKELFCSYIPMNSLVLWSDYVQRETLATSVLTMFSLMASFSTRDAEGKLGGVPSVGRLRPTYLLLIAP